MKKISSFLMLGLMISSFSYAQVNPYSDEQNPMGTPEEFPEDEFYTPEEMTPEEQEDQMMMPAEEQWDLGEPLPSDEEVPLTPEEDYDSF